MIEIDDLSLNEWYACLKPYQKVVIEQLVSKYGEEKAAEEWLTARGPFKQQHSEVVKPIRQKPKTIGAD